MIKSLSQIVWQTVHNSKKSVPEIADDVGCSDSLLYKTANVNEPVELKLSRLLPLMRSTGNYSILKHLALRAGFALVKVPKGRRMKTEEIAGHQGTLAKYVEALVGFSNGNLKAEEVHGIVDQALCEVAMAKRMVEADSSQQEMFEEV